MEQEVFHSVKIKAMEVGDLQLDLNRAYGRVSWGFILLILIQIGLPFRMMKWIMGYVNSMSYDVLVNCSPTDIFQVERGLQQGFLLSPFLFLLVIEGLSRLLLKA